MCIYTLHIYYMLHLYISYTGLLGAEELLRVISQAQLDLKTVSREDLKWSDLRRDTDVAIIELGHHLAREKQKQLEIISGSVGMVVEPQDVTEERADLGGEVDVPGV